jgi:predicted nucleic acid-binding protein
VRRYLLDTNTLADFINRRRGVAVRVDEVRKRGDRIVTCLPVVGELFAGVEHSASRERNHQRLILALQRIPAWPFDRGAAEEFGRIDAHLRRLGREQRQRPVGRARPDRRELGNGMKNTAAYSTWCGAAALPNVSAA